MRRMEGARRRCGGPSCRRSFSLLVALLIAAAVASGCAGAQRGRTIAEVSFTHGVVAFHENDFQAATALLEEAAREDPAEGTYQHWLAAAYLRLGRGADAVASLEKSIRAKHPPASGAARVQADLQQVRESVERKAPLPQLPEPAVSLEVRFPEPQSWQGEIGLAGAYDSNPRLLVEDLGASGFGPTEEAQGDAATLLDVRLDYQPLWDRGGWSFGLTAAGHGALHADLDDTDLTLARGIASLAWGRNGGGLVGAPLGSALVPAGGGPAVVLQGGAVYARLGEEELLRSWEGAVAVVLPETSRTETRLTVTGRDREYAAGAGPLRAGDEREISAGVEQVVFLGRRDRYLGVGFEGGEVSTNRFQAASFTQASAEIAFPLSSCCMLFLSGARRDDRYDNPESNLGRAFGPARDDVTWRLAATGLWRATPRLQWVARGAFIRRESNVELAPGVPLLDYDRTVLSLGLRWVP